MTTKESARFSISLENSQYYVVIIKQDVEMEVDDIKLLVEFQKILGGEKKHPAMTVPSPTSTTNSELIRYISKNINLPYTSVDAFVLSSVPHKILAKLYTRFSPPERPTGFFTSKEDALTWIKKYIE